MPVIRAADAPVFEFSLPGATGKVPHIRVRGYASPSRGSTQTSMWRLTLNPNCPPRPGTVDHEEIFFLLSGCADVVLGGTRYDLKAGDALIIPPDVEFAIGNPYDEPVEFVTILPVGGRGRDTGSDEMFDPPWAQ